MSKLRKNCKNRGKNCEKN